MINNLFVSGREYGYGYDSYYVSRRDESISFPSDSAIALSLKPNAYDYTVKTMPVSVSKEVKGTLKSYSLTTSGYLVKVAQHLTSTNIIVNEVDVGEDVYTYTVVNSYKGEEIAPQIVSGTLSGTIYNNDIAIQTFTVDLGSTNLNLIDVGSPGTKATSGDYADNVLSLSWNGSTTDSYVLITYKYESPDSVSVMVPNMPVFNYRNIVVNESHLNDPLDPENLLPTVTSLNNTPIINNSVGGVIYFEDTVVQEFIVDTEGDLSFTNINISGGTYVDSGALDFSTGELTLVWRSGSEGDTSVKVDYTHGYDFVSLFGKTNIDTKYVKIMSTVKCKYQNSYTNVSSKLFYTRCKSFQTLCSSTSSGYVPAITVCSENLF